MQVALKQKSNDKEDQPNSHLMFSLACKTPVVMQKVCACRKVTWFLYVERFVLWNYLVISFTAGVAQVQMAVFHPKA